MSVQTLIEQIVNHPNSSFAPEAIAELEILSEPVLQQVLFSLASAPEKEVQTLNSTQTNSAELQTLLEDLKICQEDLQSVAREETRLLTALNKFGVKRPSVLTYNTNNAASMNDLMIQKYIQSAGTPLAVMLCEGVAARRELRGKAINEILSCSSSVYSPQDLERMSSADLSKLSSALQVKARPVPQPDFSAMAMADNFRQVTSTFNPMMMAGDGVISQDPLEVPDLWRSYQAPLVPVK